MNNKLVRWERYAPISLGLEETFRRLDALADNEAAEGYPKYNIVKLDDDSQQLQIALAGWSRNEIEVSVERRVLNVKTIAPKLDESEFIHKGIATRTFSRNWQLSEDTVVGDVKYVDGLLSITLTKEVPEELKRRVLPIAE